MDISAHKHHVPFPSYLEKELLALLGKDTFFGAMFHIAEERSSLTDFASSFSCTSYSHAKNYCRELFEGDVLFDTVIFDGSSLKKEDGARSTRQQANLLLTQGKNLLSHIESQLPALSKIHYSLEDMTSFFEMNQNKDHEALSRFVLELKEKSQISDSVYEELKKRYTLKQKAIEPNKEMKEDPITDCLFQCLEKGLKPGGRFIALYPDALSKFEDPQYFEKIITSSRYNFQERVLSYDDPSRCHQDILLFCVEKVG